MQTRAAVLYSMGHAAPYAHSRPLVVETLELDGPGPGEVLVEIAAAGLCHSDLSVIDATRPRAMPMVLGHEASGIVRDVGRDVHDLVPDDHVVFAFVPLCGRCAACSSGRPALCEAGARANQAGTLLGGGRRFRNADDQRLHHHLGVSAFSELTVASRASLVKIDPELPLAEAALFGCAVMTGVGAVMNTARVEPGASVVVFGLGGVGLSAVMGACAAGAHPVIAVDPIEDKLRLAREVGATYAIEAAGAVEAVRDLTDGGADYAFETAGNERALHAAYAATRRGGTTVTVGLPHPSRHFTVQAVSLVTEERTVKGSYMGSAVPARDVPRFIRLYQAGRLPVDRLLSGTISLDEINPAFDRLAQGAAVRQVVRPA
jgi:alcohol dehydrogenase